MAPTYLLTISKGVVVCGRERNLPIVRSRRVARRVIPAGRNLLRYRRNLLRRLRHVPLAFIERIFGERIAVSRTQVLVRTRSSTIFGVGSTSG